ncbi:MAG: DUF1587 domain-containing protein, partial [Acidobacteriota bacterium]
MAIALTGVGDLHAASQEVSNAIPQDASLYSAVLNRYCITCHNEKLKTADLVLSKLDIANPGADAPVWEKVARKLRTGQMPPAGMPRPEQAFYDGFAAYLETALDRAAAAKPDPGRPAVHRLNRAEYTNAVRDLLATDIDGASLLPADDASRGFDNIADILSVSPLLVERYMSAARKISRLAVGDPNVRPFTVEYNVSRRLVQDGRMSEDLPFGSRGGTAIRHHFPLGGEYLIKIRLQRNNDNHIRGLGEPHQLDVRLDGARLQLFTIGGEHQGRSGPIYAFINKDYLGDPEQANYEFSADAGLEVRFQAKAGVRLVGVAFLKQPSEPEGELMPRQFYDELLSFKGGDPAVDNVSISGPFNPKGLGDTPSRRRIFVCNPADIADEESCAKKLLSTLARRAYRRPVTEADVLTLLQFYQVGRSQGGFEAGIRTAIQGILVSPEFLFRMERDPGRDTERNNGNAAPGTAYPVSNLEMASRLSFFLWSSIPDDKLLG